MAPSAQNAVRRASKTVNSDCGVAANVFVLETLSSHAEVISRVIGVCGSHVLWVTGAAMTVDSGLRSRGRVVLIGLECEPDENSQVLGVIQSLRGAGYKILACADHLERWSLRARCLPLLAGAAHLLGSSGSGFEKELHGVLSRCLEAESRRETEEREIKQRMAEVGVIGESEAMMEVFRTTMRVSTVSDLSALITGETGTGKERLAQAIHLLDPKRRTGPFIPLNCAALSASLAESELFGHRRGAFTGAERERKGLFRAAHGGVLFLDEIGELDGAMQGKLLRVLQESRVRGVGDEQEVAVDVRVVAATNRDLRSLVQENKFRADLFHRLNILSVHIPPLRNRTADIRPLVHFFLAKHERLRPNERLSAGTDFVEALAQMTLPGNVRQLETIVCNALVHKAEDVPLHLEDLPAEAWMGLCNGKPGSGTNSNELTAALPDQWGELLQVHGNLARCLQCCERGVLAAALQRTGGNQSWTARMLGLTPRSIYSKLQQYQLARRDPGLRGK